MSSMERNKGKLIPVEINTEGFSYEDWDKFTEDGFATIAGKNYKVEWEVNQDSDCCGFADVKTNPDGSIDFHTYHYNGGGYWTEVVEGALN